MRLLLCNSQACKGKPAMLPKNAAFPQGEPYISSRHVPYFKCDRCKLATTLTAPEFNALTPLTADDFKALGKQYGGNLANLPTQDLVGAGFTKPQASDLFGAGFADPSELALLERELDGNTPVP